MLACLVVVKNVSIVSASLQFGLCALPKDHPCWEADSAEKLNQTADNQKQLCVDRWTIESDSQERKRKPEPQRLGANGRAQDATARSTRENPMRNGDACARADSATIRDSEESEATARSTGVKTRDATARSERASPGRNSQEPQGELMMQRRRYSPATTRSTREAQDATAGSEQGEPQTQQPRTYGRAQDATATLTHRNTYSQASIRQGNRHTSVSTRHAPQR